MTAGGFCVAAVFFFFRGGVTDLLLWCETRRKEKEKYNIMDTDCELWV